MSIDLPVLSIATVQHKARKALLRGESINSNPYPFHSAAFKTWCEEFERMEKAETVKVAA